MAELTITCPYFDSCASYGANCQIRCGGAGRRVFDEPEARYKYQLEHCTTYDGQQTCPLYIAELAREDAGDTWTSANEDTPQLAEGHRTVSIGVEVLLSNNDIGEGYYDYSRDRWYIYQSGDNSYHLTKLSNPVAQWRQKKRGEHRWVSEKA